MAGKGKLVSTEYPGCRWAPRAPFLPPVSAAGEGQTAAGIFRFLNHGEQLGFPPDWEPAGLAKLWRYHLHYQDYLWELEFDQARAVVLDWIGRYGPGRNRDGWEAYPVSLRLVNWCGYFYGRHQERMAREPEFGRVLWGAIHQQAAWLETHLETHLLGNHYLENGVALGVVGACFGGAAASAWLARGVEILREQLPEQMLADGCHFERSPMYHARVAWCLLTLLNTGAPALAELVRGPLEKGLQALAQLCHADGQIALLNDSALGMGANPRELMKYGAQLGVAGGTERELAGAWGLPQAGYYGWRGEDGTGILCDAGPVGPDYLPGHAHGDIFSYELCYEGRRIIVDSGVFDYEVSEMRAGCRATRAHNTVVIEGQDQCEFWGAFRVGRRGQPRAVRWEPEAAGFQLQGWHDGYQRLPGKPVHARRFQWRSGGSLEVADEVWAGRPVAMVSRIHLHPECGVMSCSARGAELGTPAGRVAVQFSGPGRLQIEDGRYCPEFGRQIRNQVLAWEVRGAEARFGYRVERIR
jgi:uncharacterized heparinase superfamily protein